MSAKRSRSSRGGRSGPSVKALSKSLSKLKRQLKAEVEVKFINQVSATNGPLVADTVRTFSILPTSGQGVDTDERVGNKVTHTNAELRYSMYIALSDMCRIMVVRFPEPPTAVPTPTDLQHVLTYGDQAIGILQDPQSAMLSGYKQGGDVRYQVLYDKVHIGDSHTVVGRARVLSKPQQTAYSDLGATPEKNDIRVYIFNISSVGLTVDYHCQYRTSYTDL